MVLGCLRVWLVSFEIEGCSVWDLALLMLKPCARAESKLKRHIACLCSDMQSSLTLLPCYSNSPDKL